MVFTNDKFNSFVHEEEEEEKPGFIGIGNVRLIIFFYEWGQHWQLSMAQVGDPVSLEERAEEVQDRAFTRLDI